EVLNSCVDRPHHGDVIALNPPGLEQVCCVDVGEHDVGFFNSAAKSTREIRTRPSIALIELLLPLSPMGCSTNPADDPLAEVAVEMQDQIADAVRLVVGSPPHVLGRKSVDGLLDAGQIAVHEELARLLDERARDVGHDAAILTGLAPRSIATGSTMRAMRSRALAITSPIA